MLMKRIMHLQVDQKLKEKKINDTIYFTIKTEAVLRFFFVDKFNGNYQ